MVKTGIADFLELVHQLDDVVETDHGRYRRFEVGGRTFGYLWEPTRTVGLKQTIAEQLALVAERPDVFEIQFTAWGFGWVVVHLEGVEDAAAYVETPVAAVVGPLDVGQLGDQLQEVGYLGAGHGTESAGCGNERPHGGVEPSEPA